MKNDLSNGYFVSGDNKTHSGADDDDYDIYDDDGRARDAR